METMELAAGVPDSWIATHVANDFTTSINQRVGHLSTSFFTTTLSMHSNREETGEEFSRPEGHEDQGHGKERDIVQPLAVRCLLKPDLYEAIRRGVVDGPYLTMETYKGFKTEKLLKIIQIHGRWAAVLPLLCGHEQQKWNKLPRMLQSCY